MKMLAGANTKVYPRASTEGVARRCTAFSRLSLLGDSQTRNDELCRLAREASGSLSDQGSMRGRRRRRRRRSREEDYETAEHGEKELTKESSPGRSSV